MLLWMTTVPSASSPALSLRRVLKGFGNPSPLHFVQTSADVTLLFILLSGLASVVLVSAGAVALVRRRSRSFLLVALALGTLAAKAFVGVATILLSLPADLHHTMEHGLDFVTATCLLLAVYFARNVSSRERARELSESGKRGGDGAALSTEGSDD